MKNKKIYIKGNLSRQEDVISELLKLGAKNAFAYYGNVEFNYYYIDKRNTIRHTEDVGLLHDAGYKELILPPQCDILPFSSSEDVAKACLEHGTEVRNKCSCSLFEIERIISFIKAHHTDEEAYRHLVEFYEFGDGTPCGRVVERKRNQL